MRPLRSMWLLGLACGWLVLTASAVRAAEKTAPADDTVIYPRTAATAAAPVAPAPSGSTSSGLIVAAVLMAAAGGWLYWRARHAPGGRPAARHLAIAETKALGNRQYLVVASYQDKKFLLGVCPGRIDLLTALDEKPGADCS